MYVIENFYIELLISQILIIFKHLIVRYIYIYIIPYHFFPLLNNFIMHLFVLISIIYKLVIHFNCIPFQKVYHAI